MRNLLELLVVWICSVQGVAVVARAGRAAPQMVAPQLVSSAEPVVQVLCAAGLSEAQAQEVWGRRPPGRLPGIVQQVALIEWLQLDPLAGSNMHSERLLYMALHASPKLMLYAGKLPQLKATLEAVRAALKELTQRQLALTLAHNPGILLLSPADVELRAASLQKATSLDAAELTAALSAAPRLLLLVPEQIEARAGWIRARLSIQEGELRRVVAKAPLTMLAKTSSFESRISMLASLGLSESLTSLLVVRSPRLIHFPAAELLSRVDWLRQSGVARDEAELSSFLSREPDFFNVARSVCEARLAWLSSTCGEPGAPDTEGAAAMLRAEPRILTQQSEALQLRAELWESMLGGSSADLVKVPHLFTCNLGRTVLLRKAYCLLAGVDVAPVDLLVKDVSCFCADVAGCTEKELHQFEADGNHLRLFSAL